MPTKKPAAAVKPLEAGTFKEAVQVALQEKKVEDAQKVALQIHTFTFPDGVTLSTSFALNDGQRGALENMAEWASNPNIAFYNLQGYAGTGKTTILKLFIKYLNKIRQRTKSQPSVENAFRRTGAILLAAPTHRARQVLFNLAGEDVSKEDCLTIHSLLALRPDFDMDDLDLRNLPFSTKGQSKMPASGLVIVDETSMVSDKLLEVLYKVATTLNTKMLFVGDPAQLKPVKQNTISQAFSIKFRSELRQVMRQADGNPIGPLLEAIRNNQHVPHDSFAYYNRISAKGEGILFTNVSSDGRQWFLDKVIGEDFKDDANYARVLCGTNKRCYQYNQSIRDVRYGRGAPEYVEGELLSGFANYGSDESFENLITNSGDYLVVKAVETHRELIGLQVPGWFLTVVDADHEQPVSRRQKKTIFIVARHAGQDVLQMLGEHLNKLQKEAIIASKQIPKPPYPWAKFHAFKESFCTAVDYLKGKFMLLRKTLDYGYALTVHKSQGGTYSYVMVDETDISAAFYQDHQLRHQLLYVALSRASKQVLCLTNKPIQPPVFDF